MKEIKLNDNGFKWRYILFIVLIFLGYLVYLSASWCYKKFGAVGFEQILYHLFTPLRGTNENVIQSYIQSCLNPAFCIALVSYIVVFWAYIRWVSARQKRMFQPKYISDMSIIPVSEKLIASLALFVFISLTLVAGAQVKIFSYISGQATYTTLFEEYYVQADSVNIVFPEDKRNLIFIYLESMENSYMSPEDGGTFDENIIPELTSLAQDNINFSNTNGVGGPYSLETVGYTSASLVVNTASTPIKIPGTKLLKGFRQFSNTEENYLPNTDAIGDILEEAGYRQILMIGSKAEFGARQTYFEQHGNYEIYDYHEAVTRGKIAPDYWTFWGFEDAKLFSYAKEELLELAEGEHPFNLTLLTVDTHFPEGGQCEYCRPEYDNQYKNVMACSSRQVAAFVEWVQAQEFYEDTTIVIVGDHPTMQEDFVDSSIPYTNRTTYHVIINSAVQTENVKNRVYTCYDTFPTTLAAMGVQIEGERLGLGVNLFSDIRTVPEEIGIEEFNSQLKLNSRYFNNYILS